MKYLLLVAFVSVATLTGCQKSQENKSSSSNEQKPLMHIMATAMQVVDAQGSPIVGAKVMVGDVSSGRAIIVTDESGMFQAPADWKTAETVSIMAANFTRATFYNQMPGAQKYQLRTEDKVASLEVKGVTSGFDGYIVDKDGNLDFGLVLPMFKRSELAFFNESQVVSAENDYISVYGQRIPVPSNISIPKQTEKYGFVSVTVEKPAYRLKVSQMGKQPFIAIRARADVDSLKNRLPPLELLNRVITGGGSERLVDVTNAGATANFVMNEKQFTAKMSVTAPVIPANMVMLTMPLAKSGDYLFPSDVKSLKAKESKQLNVPTSGVSDLLNAVISPDRIKNHAASANIISLASGKPIQFLGLIAPPKGDMQKIMTAIPTIPEGVEPAGMYVTLSTVEVKNLDDQQVESTLRVWEIYLDSWTDQILLPKLPADLSFNLEEKVQYRWEVSFMARDVMGLFLQTAELSGNLDVAYVTRNSVDL